MVSSKKKFLTSFLRGTAITIIIYIMVSMLTTKIIYDSVFKRYDSENVPNTYTESIETIITKKTYLYPCGENQLKGKLYSSGSCKYGLIVLAPGFNAESLEYIGVTNALIQEGFDVFCFDPTGHGESGGENSIGFPQIINDIDSTLNFINGNKNFKYENIFLLGHSRGGYGVCCTMNYHNNIDAVISINGTDTAMDAIMAYSINHVGIIAYGNYPFLTAYQNMLFGAKLSRKSAIEEIEKSKLPVLVIQSGNDETITPNEYSIYSKRETVKSKNTRFALYNKENHAGHTSILYDMNGVPNSDIIKKIAKFYKENS